MIRLIDTDRPFPTPYPTLEQALLGCSDVQDGLLIDEDGVILADIQIGQVDLRGAGGTPKANGPQVPAA